MTDNYENIFAHIQQKNCVKASMTLRRSYTRNNKNNTLTQNTIPENERKRKERPTVWKCVYTSEAL